MTQHTQGPWVVNGNQVHAVNKHETFVADVFDQNGDAKANARLIAAAPDLLDVCEDALAVELECWPEGSELASRLEAAIKKAKGS